MSETDSILKKLLIALLHEAAEIEQQLMLQYLYAAFSLKKYPDRTCSPAQYEAVRRWGSTILMVARGEMEHLALVNGMLSAIGAEPFFDRHNIPVQMPHFRGENLAIGRDRGRDRATGSEPCDIPFVWERFNLPTIQRFVCAESPSLDSLQQEGMPIPEWCFSCGEDNPLRAAAAGERKRPPLLYPLAGSHIPDDLWRDAQAELAQVPELRASAANDTVRPGTIQEVYKLIDDLFVYLSNRENLFIGNPANQVFVPVEYQINLFPITDLATARTAIAQIVEEGEGIDAPPDYQTHFSRFFRIHDELKAMLAEDPAFEPSMPLLFNPEPRDIPSEFARQVFDLFNYAYTTLVFMLTSLYRDYKPEASQSYPYFSSALQENAFGPMMTMIIRPLAEILAYTASGDGEHTTGPNYHLTAEDRKLLRDPAARELGDIAFFLARFDEIVARLTALGGGYSGERLAALSREPGDAPFLERQLAFVLQSATLLTNGLRRIYQEGQLPAFLVNPPQS